MIKLEKKLLKMYLTNYNLLIAQDLWQAHYQILSIKLGVNMDIVVRNVKLVELHTNNGTVSLNT